jgi:hypothetical protein
MDEVVTSPDRVLQVPSMGWVKGITKSGMKWGGMEGSRDALRILLHRAAAEAANCFFFQLPASKIYFRTCPWLAE